MLIQKLPSCWECFLSDWGVRENDYPLHENYFLLPCRCSNSLFSHYGFSPYPDVVQTLSRAVQNNWEGLCRCKGKTWNAFCPILWPYMGFEMGCACCHESRKAGALEVKSLFLLLFLFGFFFAFVDTTHLPIAWICAWLTRCGRFVNRLIDTN